MTMSTQNQAEHAVIHSSIALLQERFKQLQRVKEMREKKELLRLFSDHYNINTTSTTTATTTTATTTTTPCSDSSFNHEPPTIHNTTTNNDVNVLDVHDNDNDDVEELQIFLPPNYYYYSNYNRTNNKPTSSISHQNHQTSPNNYHNNNNNIKSISNLNNDISLSLWPPANNATAAAATEQLRRGSFDAPLSKLSRPPSSCLSSAFKFEDSQHVSDVDTTLHL